MLSWLPENISTFGGDIDWVFAYIYYIVGFWFILVEVILFYAVLRYRRKEGQKASYVRGDKWSELAWIIVPVVIVVFLDVTIDLASGPVWAKIKEQRPTDGILVRVRGKQFNWEFTYAGPDNKLGTEDDVTMDNELHVPVNQNILVQLESKDVIHGFFIPTVRIKQDVLPGRSIPGWFNPSKVGHYEIACTELCGFGHYNMRAFLEVHTPEEYQAWVEKQWPPAGGAQG